MNTNRFFNRRVITAMLCSILAATSVKAAESSSHDVTVRVDVNKRTIAIADPFEVTITVESPNDVDVKFPMPTKKVGPFDVLGVRDHLDIPSESGRQWIRKYQLETIETGEHQLPEFEVAYVDRRGSKPVPGTVKAAVKTLNIMSSIAAEDSPESYRDIKGAVMLAEPQPWLNAWRIGALATVGLLLAFAAFLYQRLKKPLTPRQWALRALDDLGNSEDAKNGKYEFVYEQAADVIRGFMHSRLDVSAPWLTTKEFFKQLKTDDRLTDATRDRLVRFMKSADLVKFAALCCDKAVLKKALDDAKQFVDQCDDDAPELERKKAELDDAGVVPKANGTSRKHAIPQSNGRF